MNIINSNWKNKQLNLITKPFSSSSLPNDPIRFLKSLQLAGGILNE